MRAARITAWARSVFPGLLLAALLLAPAAQAAPPAGTRNSTTTLQWDANDRLQRLTDPDAVATTYQYDGFGEVISSTSPDRGTTHYRYDAASNLTRRTDAKGHTVTYTYDALNRLTDRRGDHTIQYRYDEADSVTGCRRSYPIGRLTSILEADVSTVYCYNILGQVSQLSQTQDGVTDTTTITTTRGGRLARLQFPDGNALSYRRDVVGNIAASHADTASGSLDLVRDARYVPFGPIAQYTLGSGQTVIRTYDLNGRLIALDSPVLHLRLERDAMGRVIHNGGASYYYDALNRLSRWYDTTANETYSYSHAGDRLSQTANQITIPYRYQAGSHRLTGVGAAQRSLDADGNTVSQTYRGDTFSYTYDDENQLTSVSRNGVLIVRYVYNGQRQRVAETTFFPVQRTTRFSYDLRGHLLTEISGNHSRDYVWIDDLPVVVIDTENGVSTVRYVIADGLDTPRVITDAQGNIVWHWKGPNDPFGEQPPVSSNGFVYNLRFPGQYYDQASGLIHNGVRDYDPATGRYLQPDPIGLKGGLNPYAYAGNDPLSYVDPRGLQFEEVPDAEETPEEAWEENPGLGPNMAASEATGRSGNPLENSRFQPNINDPTNINGIDYSGHALDQMQNRGYLPSVVENAINNGEQFDTKPGTTGYYDPVNNVRVIVNSNTGNIITVIPGRPSRGGR
jgi:RHS repeat-associated protein